MELILTQKVISSPDIGYGFYWNYRVGPYFSILSQQNGKIEERVFLKFEKPIISFILVGDTLAITTEDYCGFYLITYKSEKPIKLGEFKGCNPFTFFAYDTGGIYIGIPKGRELNIYSFKNNSLKLVKTKNFNFNPKICDVINGEFECVPYDGGLDWGGFLDDSTYYAIERNNIKVFRNKELLIEKSTDKKPLSVSASHGFLYISTVEGIYCIDLNTKSEGFVKFPALKVYAAKYSFLVLVEDIDGCINVFKPIFRPPSLRFLTRAGTRFCKN